MTGYMVKAEMDIDDGAFHDTIDVELTGIVHSNREDAKREMEEYFVLPTLAGMRMWIEEV